MRAFINTRFFRLERGAVQPSLNRSQLSRKERVINERNFALLACFTLPRMDVDVVSWVMARIFAPGKEKGGSLVLENWLFGGSLKFKRNFDFFLLRGGRAFDVSFVHFS